MSEELHCFLTAILRTGDMLQVFLKQLREVLSSYYIQDVVQQSHEE